LRSFIAIPFIAIAHCSSATESARVTKLALVPENERLEQLPRETKLASPH
jgi:hypothetical protein